jgi:hypothetical protein
MFEMIIFFQVRDKKEAKFTVIRSNDALETQQNVNELDVEDARSAKREAYVMMSKTHA